MNRRKKMRVLFPYVGDSIGGSHISSLILIENLIEFGIEPIILLHEKGKHAVWLEKKKIKYLIFKLPYWSKKNPYINWLIILSVALKARNFLLKNRIDIVHCNDRRMQYSWSLWSKCANIPFVWHQRTKWPTYNRHINFSLKFVTGIISITKFIDNTCNNDTIYREVIYNPINKYKCKKRKKIRDDLSLSQECILIGTFGNSQKWKKPETFVKTAEYYLKHYDRKAIFIWVGNDKDGILTELIKKAKLGDSLIRLPFRSDVLDVMSEFDVIISSSIDEPFGRTVVEAMSVCVPIIASESGGHLEIITNNKNGLFFPVDDYRACSNAIWKVVSNKNYRNRIVIEGLKTVDKFNPRMHTKKVVEFYKKIMQLKNARREIHK